MAVNRSAGQLCCRASSAAKLGVGPGGGGNRPTAGRQFDDLLGRVGLGSRANVSQFRGDARAADVHPPADDQGPADAAADVRIEDDPPAASGAEAGLAQSGHVGIVGHAGRQAERLAAPIGQREVVPAGHVMALDDPAGRRVDRSAEAEADGLDGYSAIRGAAICCDLAGGCLRRRRPGERRPAASAVSFPLFRGADAELQLRAADFNAEEHEYAHVFRSIVLND